MDFDYIVLVDNSTTSPVDSTVPLRSHQNERDASHKFTDIQFGSEHSSPQFDGGANTKNKRIRISSHDIPSSLSDLENKCIRFVGQTINTLTKETTIWRNLSLNFKKVSNIRCGKSL